MREYDINQIVEIVRSSLDKEPFGDGYHFKGLRGKDRRTAGVTSPLEISVCEVQDTGFSGVQDVQIGCVNLHVPQGPHFAVSVIANEARYDSVMRKVAENLEAQTGYIIIYFPGASPQNKQRENFSF